MTYLQALTAIVHGFKICFGQKEIRKLAIRPWLIGIVCYIASLLAAYYLHTPVLNWIVDEPNGFLSTLVFYGAWLLVTTGLLIVSMIVSITFVMILSGPFQTAIAQKVFLLYEKNIPIEETGIGATAKEIGRTVLHESAKLLWLLPLLILAVIVGFIPLACSNCFTLRKLVTCISVYRYPSRYFKKTYSNKNLICC